MASRVKRDYGSNGRQGSQDSEDPLLGTGTGTD